MYFTATKQLKKISLDQTVPFYSKQRERNQSIANFCIHKTRSAVKAAEHNKTIALKHVIIAASPATIWQSVHCYLFSKGSVRETNSHNYPVILLAGKSHDLTYTHTQIWNSTPLELRVG